MALTKIDQYAVMYSANQFVPRIWLKSNNQWIGQLIFKPNGTTLPADGMSGNQVNLYYHLDDYQNLIDLLRNESPMYLLYNSANSENGIKTTDEAVGEGETQQSFTAACLRAPLISLGVLWLSGRSESRRARPFRNDLKWAI